MSDVTSRLVGLRGNSQLARVFRGAGQPAVHPHGVYVTLLLTLRCNLRCAHCIYGSNPERVEVMSARDATVALDLCASIDPPPRVYLSGGEPTLHPSFLPILLHGLARLPELHLATNGRWIGSEAVSFGMVPGSELALLLSVAEQCASLRIRVGLDRAHLLADAAIAGSLRALLSSEIGARLWERRQLVLNINTTTPAAAAALLREIGIDARILSDDVSAMWNPLLDPRRFDPSEPDFVVVAPPRRVYINNAAYLSTSGGRDLAELPMVVSEARERWFAGRG